MANWWRKKAGVSGRINTTGPLRRRKWIFGGIDDSRNFFFMEAVKDRSENDFLA